MKKTTIAALITIAAAGYASALFAQAVGVGVGANVGAGVNAGAAGVNAGAAVNSRESVTADEQLAKERAIAEERAKARARYESSESAGRAHADPGDRRTVYGDGRSRSGYTGSASTAAGASGSLQR